MVSIASTDLKRTFHNLYTRSHLQDTLRPLVQQGFPISGKYLHMKLEAQFLITMILLSYIQKTSIIKKVQLI